MNQKDLQHFKDLLESRQTLVLEKLGHLEETTKSASRRDSSGELSAYPTHMPDQGTDAMEREMTFHFVSLDGNYLHHIEQALERIEQGTFGACSLCGQEIGRDRLEAVPHTTLCIKCKSDEEKHRA